MGRFAKTVELPVNASQAFDWHARPGAFERLMPPWQRLEIVEPALPTEGSRAVFKVYQGPVPLKWVAEHRDVIPGQQFRDIQTSGPFASWEHLHAFEDIEGGGSRLHDTIDYRLPGGPLGNALGAGKVASDLERLFRFRHGRTLADLTAHHQDVDLPRQRVAIAGASGLVGSQLAAFLSTGGHEVVRLVRGRSPANAGEISWDPATGRLEGEARENLDALVYLAGEGIADGRWTEARKKRLIESRVHAVERLTAELGKLESPPRAFLSASGIGYNDEGFLADLAHRWEDAARGAEAFGARVVMLRFGVVLAGQGGALAKMLPAFRLGLGGPLGSGRQIMSWVALDDAVGATYHALKSDASGPLNVTAPKPVSQGEMAKTLGRILRRPAFAPAPAPVLRLVFGEMADQTLLSDIEALPDGLVDLGYDFRFPDLADALGHELGLA